ncbi:hypothetical protein MRB53_041938 [Persea americana]|nr:hypothetical protein MRB53_041938 [Persea americana]
MSRQSPGKSNESSDGGDSGIGQQQEANRDMKRLVRTSSASESDVSSFQSSSHPVTPKLLFECAKKGEVQQVLNMLDSHIDSLSQGQFEWIRDLVALGHSHSEIAEILVDAETKTPWVFFDLSNPGDSQLSCTSHQPRCVHKAGPLSSLPGSLLNVGEVPAFIDYVSSPDMQTDLKSKVTALCGLAGVAPISRNLEDWNGTVNFTHNLDIVTANVSYRLEDPALNDTDSTLRRLSRIANNLVSAVALLQKNGACCTSFTILRKRLNLLEMSQCRIETIPSIVEVLDTEKQGQLHTDDDTQDLLFPVLHQLAITLQVLCLGFLSYSRGHAGRINPFFVAHGIDEFVLCGLKEQNDRVETRVKAELLHMTCMGDLLDRPVLVFHPTSKLDSKNSLRRFDLLASVEDVIDAWGPALLQTTPDLLQQDLICSAKLQGGLLRVSSSSPETLHWESSSETLVPEFDDVASAKFSLRTKYVMGTLSDNENCPLQERLAQETSWAAEFDSFQILGTRPEIWHQSSRTVSMTAGQYVQVGVGALFTRLDETTTKDAILTAFEHAIHWPVNILDAHYGLQVSLCTHIARRVPLRVLLADVLPAYMASHVFESVGWSRQSGLLVEALRTSNFEGLSTENCIRDNHVQIHELLSRILSDLRATGIGRDGSFRIGIPCRMPQCLKLECTNKNLWARILEDTEHDCATFAYVTTQCLQHDRIRCSGDVVLHWQDRSELLLTEVRVEPAPASLGSLDLPTSSTQVNEFCHGTEYSIGAPMSNLVAMVHRDQSCTHPTLLVSCSTSQRLAQRLPKYIKRAMKLRAKRRLRERGSAGGKLVEVAVRAKIVPGAEGP